MRVSKGIIRAYDATNHKADVLLVGSLSRVALGVPVAYQVAPEQVAKDTVCGVVFFGEGDPGMVVCTVGDEPAVPLGLGGLGPAMDSYDVLRGWKDEFLGKQLDDRYTTQTSSGSVVLQDTSHGGQVRLRAFAGVGNYSRLWLGDSAGGYDTLDADKGWVQIVYGHVSGATDNCTMVFGANDSTTSNDRIWAGLISGTWRVRCTSGGTSTTVDSGISVDTDWHWFALDVYPTASGHRVDLWLDGELIASCTTNVPTVEMTPIMYVYNNQAGANRNWRMDYWAVIPRFLA